MTASWCGVMGDDGAIETSVAVVARWCTATMDADRDTVVDGGSVVTSVVAAAILSVAECLREVLKTCRMSCQIERRLMLFSAIPIPVFVTEGVVVEGTMTMVDEQV